MKIASTRNYVIGVKEEVVDIFILTNNYIKSERERKKTPQFQVGSAFTLFPL